MKESMKESGRESSCGRKIPRLRMDGWMQLNASRLIALSLLDYCCIQFGCRLPSIDSIKKEEGAEEEEEEEEEEGPNL